MIDYKIIPVRHFGRIVSYYVKINGVDFIPRNNGVTVMRPDYSHFKNNNEYPDFKSEEEVFKYFE